MVFCRFHDRSSHSKFIFIQSGFRADWAYWLSTHINQKHNVKYTFSDGCLGSHNDEERSEMRYVMRIAESSESSKHWTHRALPGYSWEHACWGVCSPLLTRSGGVSVHTTQNILSRIILKPDVSFFCFFQKGPQIPRWQMNKPNIRLFYSQ